MKRTELRIKGENEFLTLHRSSLKALAKCEAVHFFAPAARLVGDGLHEIQRGIAVRISCWFARFKQDLSHCLLRLQFNRGAYVEWLA